MRGRVEITYIAPSGRRYTKHADIPSDRPIVARDLFAAEMAIENDDGRGGAGGPGSYATPTHDITYVGGQGGAIGRLNRDVQPDIISNGSAGRPGRIGNAGPGAPGGKNGA